MRKWIENNVVKMTGIVLLWMLIVLAPLLFSMEEAAWFDVYIVLTAITFVITWKAVETSLTLIQIGLNVIHIVLHYRIEAEFTKYMGNMYLSFAYSVFITMIIVMFVCRVTWYTLKLATE